MAYGGVEAALPSSSDYLLLSARVPPAVRDAASAGVQPMVTHTWQRSAAHTLVHGAHTSGAHDYDARVTGGNDSGLGYDLMDSSMRQPTAALPLRERIAATRAAQDRRASAARAAAPHTPLFGRPITHTGGGAQAGAPRRASASRADIDGGAAGSDHRAGAPLAQARGMEAPIPIVRASREANARAGVAGRTAVAATVAATEPQRRGPPPHASVRDARRPVTAEARPSGAPPVRGVSASASARGARRQPSVAARRAPRRRDVEPPALPPPAWNSLTITSGYFDPGAAAPRHKYLINRARAEEQAVAAAAQQAAARQEAALEATMNRSRAASSVNRSSASSSARAATPLNHSAMMQDDPAVEHEARGATYRAADVPEEEQVLSTLVDDDAEHETDMGTWPAHAHTPAVAAAERDREPTSERADVTPPMLSARERAKRMAHAYGVKLGAQLQSHIRGAASGRTAAQHATAFNQQQPVSALGVRQHVPPPPALSDLPPTACVRGVHEVSPPRAHDDTNDWEVDWHGYATVPRAGEVSHEAHGAREDRRRSAVMDAHIPNVYAPVPLHTNTAAALIFVPIPITADAELETEEDVMRHTRHLGVLHAGTLSGIDTRAAERSVLPSSAAAAAMEVGNTTGALKEPVDVAPISSLQQLARLADDSAAATAQAGNAASSHLTMLIRTDAERLAEAVMSPHDLEALMQRLNTAADAEASVTARVVADDVEAAADGGRAALDVEVALATHGGSEDASLAGTTPSAAAAAAPSPSAPLPPHVLPIAWRCAQPSVDMLSEVEAYRRDMLRFHTVNEATVTAAGLNFDDIVRECTDDMFRHIFTECVAEADAAIEDLSAAFMRAV